MVHLRHSLTALVLLSSFLLIFTACGGGGGGGSAPVVALKTSTIRTFSPGDSWSYTVSGNMSLANGARYDLSGTGSETVLTSKVIDPLNATECLDLFTTMTFAVAGETITDSSHNYGVQNANGSFLVYGGSTDTVSQWVTTPPGYYEMLASPVVKGQSGGKTVDFDDGSQLTYSYTVRNSTENVGTDVGTFECYVIDLSETINNMDGSQIVSYGTDYFVPGLGYVRGTGTASYYFNSVFQFSLTLTRVLHSTNVVY